MIAVFYSNRHKNLQLSLKIKIATKHFFLASELNLKQHGLIANVDYYDLLTKESKKRCIYIYDEIHELPVLELRIEMNVYILVLSSCNFSDKQSEIFRFERVFKPGHQRFRCSALPVELSGPLMYRFL